ncbi:MAG: DUF2807 domain-containing protein [Phaeodactylibacter sp.]|nr:DUF2807 domain-containing protein [Phaeodactylibacter sp.]
MRYLIAFFCIAVLTQCMPGDGSFANWSKPALAGVGPQQKIVGQVAAFKGINLAISADVVLTYGSTQSVRMEGQQNIIDNIDTAVEDGVWNIRFKQHVKDYQKITIYITSPGLELVSITGSGDISTTNQFVGQQELRIRIAGSGDLAYDTDAKEIDCSISGSGDVKLAGSTNELSASISGSGDLYAFDLHTKNADVSIVGSGGCKLDVQNDLHASIVGSGDIQYKGNPSVQKKIVGSGDVYQK